MIEVIVLIVLAIVWLVFATVQDFRETEISDWLNFSLIIFALGFRFFYSLFADASFGFFYQGLIGLGIFFVLGNLLYYGKMFAGGDAKLMVALGVVLPLSSEFIVNLQIFLTFFFLFLIAGAAYGLITSGYYAIRNSGKFKKEFFRLFKSYKIRNTVLMTLGVLIMVAGLVWNILVFYLGIAVFVLPMLYLFAKAVDEACMVKKINSRKLREGDWLYDDVRVGKRIIRANWDGLSKKDILILKRNKKNVVIRQGIAFAPVFLVSFLALAYVYLFNAKLMNLFFRLFQLG